MKNIKRINIIIIFIITLNIIFSLPLQAIGDVFSDADNFLKERRFNIYCDK